jgi:hypothetical protein
VKWPTIEFGLFSRKFEGDMTDADTRGVLDWIAEGKLKLLYCKSEVEGASMLNRNLVTSSPLFLPNGTCLNVAGCYEKLGVRITRTTELEPLDASADECVNILLEPFCDFLFQTQADKANLLALILTPFLQLLFNRTPLFLIEAPQTGAGKSLLASTALMIPFGEVVPGTLMPESKYEWQRLITAVVRANYQQVLFFDGITRNLSSSQLAAMLTLEKWKDRSGIWPNNIICVATGNNVRTSGEIARLCVPIRLDVDCERPEERTNFKHPCLKQYVAQSRPRLAAAAVKLIADWFDAGKPKADVSFGPFERWAQILGGVLNNAGVSGFLASHLNKP